MPDGSELRRRSVSGADAERQFNEWAESQGWKCSGRGWPDYLVLDEEDHPFCVEVKETDQVRLSPSQQRVMRILERMGIPCYRWSPDAGLQRWSHVAPPMVKPYRVAPSRRALAARVVAERTRIVG